MKRAAQILLISVMVFYSCDLLTTRNPEKPEKLGSNFIPATSPEILFQNLKSAVEEKVLENYLACLVDSSFLRKKFTFIPASGSVTQYPVLNGWNYSSERQYFNNLKANLGEGSNAKLTYTKTVYTPFGDSAIYSVDYTLQIISNNITLGGDYIGTALWKIYLDSRNQWVIVEWQDIKRENFLCWSDLKGRIY